MKLTKSADDKQFYIAASNIVRIYPYEFGSNVMTNDGYDIEVRDDAATIERMRLNELKSIYQTPDYRE